MAFLPTSILKVSILRFLHLSTFYFVSRSAVIEENSDYIIVNPFGQDLYLTCSQSYSISCIHYWKLIVMFRACLYGMYLLFSCYLIVELLKPHFLCFCFCRFLECLENSGCLSGWQHSQQWVQPYWFLLWQECVMFSFASHPVYLIHLE